MILKLVRGWRVDKIHPSTVFRIKYSFSLSSGPSTPDDFLHNTSIFAFSRDSLSLNLTSTGPYTAARALDFPVIVNMIALNLAKIGKNHLLLIIDLLNYCQQHIRILDSISIDRNWFQLLSSFLEVDVVEYLDSPWGFSTLIFLSFVLVHGTTHAAPRAIASFQKKKKLTEWSQFGVGFEK